VVTVFVERGIETAGIRKGAYQIYCVRQVTQAGEKFQSDTFNTMHYKQQFVRQH